MGIGRDESLPESEDAVAGDHGDARKGAVALRVDVTERSEDVLHVRPGLAELTQRVSEDVQSVSGGDVSMFRGISRVGQTNRSSESDSELT